MKYVYPRPLADSELRAHLVMGDTVAFTDAVMDWEAIEQQVERLGFGDQYAVSRGAKPGPNGPKRRIRLSPVGFAKAA